MNDKLEYLLNIFLAIAAVVAALLLAFVANTAAIIFLAGYLIGYALIHISFGGEG